MQQDELTALADRIAETSAHLDAATHALLTDIRAFDQAGGGHRLGALTCAHYLSWRIGMGLGAAREKVRVAKALGALPQIDHALAHGQISYSKVRALTRVATPETEADLLALARSTTASQLEKICRLYRQTQHETPRRPKDAEDLRWLSSRPTDDGMVRVTVQLRPEEAATLIKAIDVAADTGTQVDRLVALAETALAGAPNPHQPVRPPVEVVVHIDAQTLTGHLADTGDGVSAETARRLCCDAGIVPTLESQGKTLDVGRKRRTIPAAIERALDARDQGCRFPGCTNRRFVDRHHIHHWAHGGETKLDNLITLCRTHHRYLHEYGYTVTLQDDHPLFRDSRGNLVPPTGPRPYLPSPVEPLRHLTHDLPITPDTQIPRWDGTPLDYEWILYTLCEAAKRAHSPPN